MSTTIRSSILPNTSWQHSQSIDSSHEFSFRYRVSCSTNFYGLQCSRFCSPLSIHSRCDPQTGDIICQQGWTGIDCNKGIRSVFLIKCEFNPDVFFVFSYLSRQL